MDKKRKRSRIDRFAGDVEIRSAGFGAEKARCVNLSLNGILVSYEGKLKVGDVCEVSFLLGRPEPVEAIIIEGKVVRQSSEGIGIEFLAMEQDSFVHLQRLVELHSSDPDRITQELTTPAFN
ncbi:MAG: PilZ domain-containing protein [Deltaproteobacteria bacterium]|nr:PilZ domain-containing protein [Deltaproteobacteria bacterium]